MSDATTTQGQYETPSDAGDDQSATVGLWLDAINLARKTEEGWVKAATAAYDRYRDEKAGNAKKFNILYANTQILLPSLYSATPRPDVRRRHGDADPTGKVAARVLERGVAYALDCHDFDAVMRACVLDMVLPGRGVARVRYQPVMTGEAVVGRDVESEHVDWRDFIVGPGRQWGEVPWIAFEHRFTREQLIAQFGAIGRTMPMDVVTGEGNRDKAPRDVPDVFKRATVYEVWDKQAKEVLFLAPTVPERLLRQVDDPLGLKDFWPVPRPIYDVPDSSSLVPLVPYDLYKAQAEELDRVTQRINALVNMCRYRGLRDASVQEITKLGDAADGDFVAVENALQFATTGGGLDRAMWVTPIETIARVIAQLEAHRAAVKETIYEITGLSDILRGATQASETATAQQIKFQSGSLRIQDRQNEVKRFARDLVRLKAEIIAEKFEPQQLIAMTGETLPTPEQKNAAQMMAEQAATQGQDVPPQIKETLETPTWDDVMAVLRSDAMRGYRVDIETDSTIQQDVARAQQNAAQFVQGFGGFMQAVGPAVQAGAMPMDVATDLLTAFARSFKLGRQAEDALERMGHEARQPKPPQEDAGAAAAAMEAQAEQQRMAAEMQAKDADRQAAAATKAAELQAKETSEAARLGFEREKLDFEREKFAFEKEMAVESARVEEERMLLEMKNKDADREAGKGGEPVKDDAQEAVKEVALLSALEQIAQGLAALQQGQAQLMAAVQAPKEAIPTRGADGLISRVLMQPVTVN